MKNITYLINKKLDYIFEIYSDSPIIAYPYFCLILTVRRP